jgi:molybdopterin converting factor subunit 1
VTVTVLAFARLRELLGFDRRSIDVAAETRVAAVWESLVRAAPAIADLRASTRFACNGELAPADRLLHDGDELALLPPVSGG